jgi:hypothetical protein
VQQGLDYIIDIIFRQLVHRNIKKLITILIFLEDMISNTGKRRVSRMTMKIEDYLSFLEGICSFDIIYLKTNEMNNHISLFEGISQFLQLKH